MKRRQAEVRLKYFMKIYLSSLSFIVLIAALILIFIFILDTQNYTKMLMKNEKDKVEHFSDDVIQETNHIFSDLIYTKHIMPYNELGVKKILESKDYYDYFIVPYKSYYEKIEKNKNVEKIESIDISEYKKNMIRGTDYFFYIDFSDTDRGMPKIKAGILEDSELKFLISESFNEIIKRVNSKFEVYYFELFLEDGERYIPLNNINGSFDSNVLIDTNLIKSSGQNYYKHGIVTYKSIFPFKETVLNQKYSIVYNWKIISYIPKESIKNIFLAEKIQKIVLFFFILLVGGIISYLFAKLLLIKKLNEISLKKEKRKADDANRAKSTFIANMSHEIRTPMNGIIGFTDILLSKELDSESKEILRLIQSSGDNLMEIINNILDISKIEAGKMKVTEMKFNIHKLLRESVKVFSVQADAKNNQLRLEIDNKVPELLIGDYIKIQQIMNNLLSNSIKFTRDGYIRVNLELKEENNSNVLIVLKIKDSGIGIPKDKQEEIFHKFIQAKNGNSAEVKGTGLGLAIVKKLVKLMNGNVSLISEEGKGTEFIVEILLKK